jgi:hypothetical protein
MMTKSLTEIQSAALAHISTRKISTSEFAAASDVLEKLLRARTNRVAILGKRGTGRNYLVNSTLKKLEGEFLCASGVLTPTRTRSGSVVASTVLFDLLNALSAPIALKSSTKDPAERFVRYLMIRCRQAKRQRVVISLRGFELVPPMALVSLEHARSLAANQSIVLQVVLQVDAKTLKDCMLSLEEVGGKSFAADHAIRHHEYKRFALDDFESLFATLDLVLMPAAEHQQARVGAIEALLPNKTTDWRFQSCAGICLDLIRATAVSARVQLPKSLPLPLVLQICWFALESLAIDGIAPAPASTKLAFSKALDLCGLTEYLQAT